MILFHEFGIPICSNKIGQSRPPWDDVKKNRNILHEKNWIQSDVRKFKISIWLCHFGQNSNTASQIYFPPQINGNVTKCPIPCCTPAPTVSHFFVPPMNSSTWKREFNLESTTNISVTFYSYKISPCWAWPCSCAWWTGWGPSCSYPPPGRTCDHHSRGMQLYF